MNSPDIIASFRQELASSVGAYTPGPLEPLPISAWVAMSTVQKAVRRGRRDIALAGAATLLRDAPDKLWRRLAVAAYEDVGLPSVGTVGLVTAALAGNKFRATLGGEWQSAAFLVERLVTACKSRAADDLLMLIERHPTLQPSRHDFAYLTIDQLLRIALSNRALPERALAIRYALGTDRCPSPYLRTRRGEPSTVFDALWDAGFPHSAVELGREAFRKHSQPLFAFLALLAAIRPHVPADVTDDDFPPEVIFGGVPSWSLDIYTREGRQALKVLLGEPCETSRWVREHLPSGKQVEFLGNVLFSVEGGLMKNRYRWKVADDLRRNVEIEAQGPYCSDATEIMNLLRADIGLLNEVRGHVL